MKKGDLCLVNLSVGEGHEQYGNRPAIVISDTTIDIIVVIPITSNINALRFPYTITVFPDKQNNLNRESVGLVFHIRAIDKSRITKIIGKINKELLEKIDKILREMLRL
jgi:mRNA interferase MazF